jgi:site-specific recombinase XerD
VAKLLGHRHIATTQRYVAHLELADLRASVPPLPLAGYIMD